MNFRLLRADEIECRISSVSGRGVQLLLYKDARCDMNILDETVGPENWQRKHKLINGNLFCSVGVFIPQLDMWVWKQDVGTESYTEKEKGQASDSFKRACFNWGIGRELYTSPFMYIGANGLTTLNEVNGKWTCRDYFKVTDITYDGRRIATVTIVNAKTEQDYTFGTPASAARIMGQRIDGVKIEALKSLCAEKGVAVEKLYERYGISTLEEMTEEMHSKAVRALLKS